MRRLDIRRSGCPARKTPEVSLRSGDTQTIDYMQFFKA